MDFNHNNIPTLPSKYHFFKLTYDDIDNRRKGLESFLINLSNRSDICNNKEFLDFLEIKINKENIPEIKLINQLSLKEFGIRDFLYFPEKKILYALTFDPSYASRLDSKLMNFSISKSNNNDIIFSIGAFEIYYINSSDDFIKSHNTIFKSEPILLKYSKLLNILLIGFDDGSINCYKVSGDDLMNISLSFEEEVHKGRVMGMEIDEKRELIYSIGEDCCLRVYDIKKKVEIYYEIVSTYKLRALYFDPVSNKTIITDGNGKLYVYDMIPVL